MRGQARECGFYPMDLYRRVRSDLSLSCALHLYFAWKVNKISAIQRAGGQVKWSVGLHRESREREREWNDDPFFFLFFRERQNHGFLYLSRLPTHTHTRAMEDSKHLKFLTLTVWHLWNAAQRAIGGREEFTVFFFCPLFFYFYRIGLDIVSV